MTVRSLLTGNYRTAALITFAVGLLSCALARQQPQGQRSFLKWANGNAAVPVVAILPFGNRTGHQDLPDQVRSAFYSHFAALPFKDLEMDLVDATLSSLGKCQGKPFESLVSPHLGEILGCQALVYGEVTTFTRIYAGLYSQIGIGAEIRMVEAKQGQTVWKDSFVTRFHEGGIPLTHVGAALSALKSSLNLGDAQELRAIDDLCRNLVARIPKPKLPGEEGKSLRLCELQVAAFRDLTKAQALQRELQDKQFAAFVRSSAETAETWHRVLLGPFASSRDAAVWKEKIATEFGITPVVLQYQNPANQNNAEPRKEKN